MLADGGEQDALCVISLEEARLAVERLARRLIPTELFWYLRQETETPRNDRPSLLYYPTRAASNAARIAASALDLPCLNPDPAASRAASHRRHRAGCQRSTT